MNLCSSPPQRLSDFTYDSPWGPVTRTAHLWTDPGRVLIVVTEHLDDSGMSVTNAAEQVWESARDLAHTIDADAELVLVEHYPNSGLWPAAGAMGERFARILMDDDGQVSWQFVPRQLMLLSIGADEFPS